MLKQTTGMSLQKRHKLNIYLNVSIYYDHVKLRKGRKQLRLSFVIDETLIQIVRAEKGGLEPFVSSFDSE